jgi:hypothetical protein
LFTLSSRPSFFALLSTHFFRRHPDATPLHTSLVLAAIVIALEAFLLLRSSRTASNIQEFPRESDSVCFNLAGELSHGRSEAVRRLMRARGTLAKSVGSQTPMTVHSEVGARIVIGL